MSTKRRDNKGRVLLNGEIQEESGRYRYRYIDILGKRREIYSWRLTEADPIPTVGEGTNHFVKKRKKQCSYSSREYLVQI